MITGRLKGYSCAAFPISFVCACMLSCDGLSLAPWTVAHQDFPGKNTGVGCHSLLQGIFLTQELNLGLLHCRWIFFYCLSHREVTRDHMACKTKTSASWPFTKISLLSEPCSRVELNYVLETPGSFTLSSKSAKNSWICGELTSDLFCTPLLPGNLDKLNHVWFYHLGQTMRKQEEIRKPSSAINAKK